MNHVRFTAPEKWLANGIRELGRAENGDAVVATVGRLRTMLEQRGHSFDDLAEQIERVGLADTDALLEPHHPFTADTVEELYRRYGRARQFLPFLVWYGDVVRRLRRGAEPTIDDRRKRADLQSRLRNALP